MSFVRYESHIEQPMLPLSSFRNHNFSIENIATLTSYAWLSAALFLITITLQQVGGYSALQAGLATLLVSLIICFYRAD